MGAFDRRGNWPDTTQHTHTHTHTHKTCKTELTGLPSPAYKNRKSNEHVLYIYIYIYIYTFLATVWKQNKKAYTALTFVHLHSFKCRKVMSQRTSKTHTHREREREREHAGTKERTSNYITGIRPNSRTVGHDKREGFRCASTGTRGRCSPSAIALYFVDWPTDKRFSESIGSALYEDNGLRAADTDKYDEVGGPKVISLSSRLRPIGQSVNRRVFRLLYRLATSHWDQTAVTVSLTSKMPIMCQIKGVCRGNWMPAAYKSAHENAGDSPT